ncbi:hypothetical protein M6D93_14255 [Jatrophihabitans telluris]|uniref:Cytochrome c domain-containing protein n=1 Tax=Jatrophihabitans telluris TaxID=2038343 RepID=A0ABY4QVJ2_9ACTN|nr:hypothetical protein [Jatrophihabitans telluris]UQX87458.1 hypothetical protein M6D93_14255 [Jatrophihabitans telluris]
MLEPADAVGDAPVDPATGRHRRRRRADQSPFEDHCDSCHGEGLQIAPAYLQWVETVDQLRARLDSVAGPIEAGIVADQLKRHESQPPAGEWDWTCPDCRGLGAVPTEEGHALLAFLDRHNRLPYDRRP